MSLARSIAGLVVFTMLGATACQHPIDRAGQPVTAPDRLEFSRDVLPILKANCAKCHMDGAHKGGLALDSRDEILKGGASGPAAVPHEPAASLIVKLITSTDPDEAMPQKSPPLSAAQIGLLRDWVAQGLPSTQASTVAAKKFRDAPFEPRHVDPPAGDGNPIDRLLVSYCAKHNVAGRAVVDDRLFARRVHLDIIGLLPTSEDMQQFLSDPRPDRRACLVRKLLDDNQRYAEHWLTFWNDALRNDYAGTGYIDGGRLQITRWLYAALYKNMPYDQFVRELIDPTPESEGFVKGIVWRGVVNASQTPQMQAAQNISQVFLGINMKCASCHDSFISNWKLEDAYGLASVFAEKPLELVRCDKPMGKTATVRFIYPKLGQIDAAAPMPQRRKQLAGILTSKENGRFSRTIVNRIWARLMGRGLVEPVDEMDNLPWNADVLDRLANDFVANGHDIRKLIERIVLSQAYQLPAAPLANERAEDYVFAGPLVRRMSGEQFVDAVSQVLGVSAGAQAADTSGLGFGPRAWWIWDDPAALKGIEGGRVFLRKSFDLAEPPQSAKVFATCDNEFIIHVNGHRVTSSIDWQKPVRLNVAKHLRAGKNVIAVEAINWPDWQTQSGLQFKGANGAGLVLFMRISIPGSTGTTKAIDIGTDKTWRTHDVLSEEWDRVDFDDSTWKPAVELVNAATANRGQIGPQLSATMNEGVIVRRSLVRADALAVALGRPNREQVVTARASAANTLQALELTNGQTLAELIAQGAKRMQADLQGSTDRLVRQAYEQALGRTPNEREVATAVQLIGNPPQPGAVEDFLWALFMLPEFQLVW